MKPIMKPMMKPKQMNMTGPKCMKMKEKMPKDMGKTRKKMK